MTNESQTQTPSSNRFIELAAINVGHHIEKKGSLSYLSWPWAIDQLLRRDPDAAWEYGEPIRYGDTMMVVCTVTAFGKPRTMHLPVMDNRNKPIANPDAFAVNTAMMRCLVKAIALHGLGLYIYAGEDLPPGDAPAEDKPTAEQTSALDKLREAAMLGTAQLQAAWKASGKDVRQYWADELPSLKTAAAEADAAQPRAA